MINNDDTNAFPYPLGHASAAEPSQSGGMTLRDYFAAKAMQALLSHHGGYVELCGDHSEPASLSEDALDNDFIADYAYNQADAMLERRKK